MAITILQDPQFGQSLHSEMWHRVYSDNVGSSDFMYIFDVYFNGSLIHRARVIPDDDIGLYDAGVVVRSFVLNYFRKLSPQVSPYFYKTDDIRVEYDVQYGEEYTTSGVTTQYINLESRTYKAYNAYNLFTNSDPSRPLVGKDHNWITDRDLDNIWMPKNGVLLLSFLNAVMGEIVLPDPWEDHTITIIPLDSNFHEISGAIATYDPIGSDKELLIIDLNPVNMDAYTGAPVSLTTYAGYKIRLNRPGGLGSSAWATIKYRCETRNLATALHFMNRFGGFETFYFWPPGRDEVDIQRQQYRRRALGPSGGNNVGEISNQGIWYETNVNYLTRLTCNRKLISDYLSEKEHDWLLQLIVSPLIYLGNPLQPVTIKENKWKKKLDKRDRMFQLEITIELPRSANAQFR